MEDKEEEEDFFLKGGDTMGYIVIKIKNKIKNKIKKGFMGSF